MGPQGFVPIEPNTVHVVSIHHKMWTNYRRAWWLAAFIPTFRRQSQEDRSTSQVCPGYMMKLSQTNRQRNRWQIQRGGMYSQTPQSSPQPSEQNKHLWNPAGQKHRTSPVWGRSPLNSGPVSLAGMTQLHLKSQNFGTYFRHLKAKET